MRAIRAARRPLFRRERAVRRERSPHAHEMAAHDIGVEVRGGDLRVLLEHAHGGVLGLHVCGAAADVVIRHRVVEKPFDRIWQGVVVAGVGAELRL